MKNIIKKLFQGRNRKILAIGLGLVLGIAVWQLWPNKTEEPENQTVRAAIGAITESVSASGQVLSVNIMSANTKASGIVKQVFVKDGDEVKEGDKILEIELDFQGEQKLAAAWSGYLSAKNSLASAQANQYTLQAEMLGKWDTFKELAESDTYKDVSSNNRNLPEFYIPKDEWLAGEAKYKNQEAVITQAQAAVNSSWLSYVQASPIITAPTAGKITSLMYVAGMSIGSLDTGSAETNQKVATIKTEGTPIISVNLAEIDVSRVEIGQAVKISFDSIKDKVFNGQVVGVDRIGQTTSGVTQYPAIIRLDEGASEIFPNMTATAEIIIAGKTEAIIVPSGALINQKGENAVRVKKGNQVTVVLVKTGLTNEVQTEIVEGIQAGEEVVVSGSVTGSGAAGVNAPFSNSGGMGGMMRLPH